MTTENNVKDRHTQVMSLLLRIAHELALAGVGRTTVPDAARLRDLAEGLMYVREEASTEIDALRGAIAAWPEQKHQPSLTGWDGCPAVVGHPCTCGADEKNAERKRARCLAGLED